MPKGMPSVLKLHHNVVAYGDDGIVSGLYE